MKLFENKITSLDMIEKIISDYNDVEKLMRKIALKEYYKLANKKKYQPDMGDSPSISIDAEDLFVSSIYKDRGEYIVILLYRPTEYENNEYYITLSRKKIEQGILEEDAQKYNL